MFLQGIKTGCWGFAGQDIKITDREVIDIQPELLVALVAGFFSGMP